jgi:hypothetical protein
MKRLTFDELKSVAEESLETDPAMELHQLAKMLNAGPQESVDSGIHLGTALGFRKAENKFLPVVNNLGDYLKIAVDRLNDILKGDDGQANKEARKFLESPGLLKILETLK